jgi:hypothetical protein
VALDAYAARDAAMQQALRESDERLKAMYTTMLKKAVADRILMFTGY